MTNYKRISVCPVCANSGEYAFSAKNYEFSKCQDKSCAHIYVDPMPTVEELDVYYAKNTSGLENSDSWTMVEDYRNNPHLVHKFYERNRIRFLRNKRYLQSQSKVLDVGCSTGMFLRVLKDQGYQNVVGVDVSQEQVTHCREVNKIQAYKNLYEIPAGEEFDLISLYAVLEHVPNPIEVLQQSVERLKSDGHLIIDVPNYRSVYRVLSRKKWLWLIPPVHLQYFNPRSMEKMARNAGLEISYASTKSTSTYTYILAYHIFERLKRDMPDTSLAASRMKLIIVSATELLMRILLSPASLLMRLSGTHNQIIYVFRRKN